MNGHFISGFVAGEGTFHMQDRGWMEFSFRVKVAECDSDIIYTMKDMFECGNVYHYETKSDKHSDVVEFAVTKKSEILENVIPFFEKYPLRNTHKAKQFNAWKKAAEEYYS